MITPFDEYPIHQTAMPVATMLDGHPNAYDRYFFNGYDPDGEWFFAAAMGVYPNRGVIDAAFSIVHDGVQRSVFASGRAPLDRSITKIGPISIEIIEPLRINKIRIAGGSGNSSIVPRSENQRIRDSDNQRIRAELVWNARTIAVEEPRQTMLDGSRPVMDATRLVQWGAWSGTIDVAGSRIEITSSRSRGTKDRSWGIRPIAGELAPGAPTSLLTQGGLFMLWAPIHFPDECTHLMLFERPDGHRWYQSAHTVPLLQQGQQSWGSEEGVKHARSVKYDLRLKPGTRRSSSATLHYDEEEPLHLEPILDFQMKGIGYLNTEWGHGIYHGESVEGYEECKIDELDPLIMPNIHVEQLVKVKRGQKTGVGVLEQLILGPHAPTGLNEILDGAK
ncbi:MAG: Rossmann-fold NAD(P)-binding domain-containing protein [Actinomycetota bacterium]